jgi:hypothetical protein
MAMSITAEEPDAAPAGLSQSGDQRMVDDARHADAVAQAPVAVDVPNPTPDKPPPQTPQKRAHLGAAPRETDFWCVIHKDTAQEDWGYALLIPKEARKLDPIDSSTSTFSAAFYGAPCWYKEGSPERDEDNVENAAHILHITVDKEAEIDSVERYNPFSGGFEPIIFTENKCSVRAKWNKPVETEDGSKLLTLALLFDECYLSDTTWYETTRNGPPYRRAGPWWEPAPRIHKSAVAPDAGTNEERNSQRDRFQRDHDGVAKSNPVVDAVHQARSTVLAMFADQFVALANSGSSKFAFAHVTDLGLVFRGPLAELENLANLQIEKNETSGATNRPLGKITVFNPVKESWFENQDPSLASARSTVGLDGVKLDWDLQFTFAARNNDDSGAMADPEQFLHHYEIVRTVEGQEFTPHAVQVKAAATLGAWHKEDDSHIVDLLAPEWQYTDDLADLAPELRRALLPSNDEAGALAGAMAWAQVFKFSESRSLSYTVTPVDIAGSRGLPKSFLVDIHRPSPPLRPAEAELRFVVKRLGANSGNAPHHSGTMPEDALAVVMGLKDTSFSAAGDPTAVNRYYVLYADPENISPSGHYGTDGLTERRLSMAVTSGDSADSRQWRLDANGFKPITDANGKVPADTFIDPLEPDHDTLVTYPYWRLLAGKTGMERVDAALSGSAAPIPKHNEGPEDFLESLWAALRQG